MPPNFKLNAGLLRAKSNLDSLSQIRRRLNILCKRSALQAVDDHHRRGYQYGCLVECASCLGLVPATRDHDVAKVSRNPCFFRGCAKSESMNSSQFYDLLWLGSIGIGLVAVIQRPIDDRSLALSNLCFKFNMSQGNQGRAGFLKSKHPQYTCLAACSGADSIPCSRRYF